ncbi:MMPL family transporter [Methylohalobius crimeensis]|uniref:MMPL family transporter n=1 Tax=Methylohalobius crimeensis TaxID=244365 RepID=UPI0003B75D92|nr:MMPL family transporter [Methylohalobius crimeensis]
MTRRLAILALLAVMAAALVAQLRLETRLSLFFLGHSDEGGQLVARFQRSVFARRYLLAIEPRSVTDSGLSAFARTFIRESQAVAGVARVWPAFQPPFSLAGMLGGYAARAPLIYSLDPAEEASRLLTPQSLPQRAERLKGALLSPFGDLVQRIAPDDPLLLTFHAFADWRDRLKPEAERRDAFYPIVLESKFEPFDSDRQQALQEALRQVFARLNRRHGEAYRLRMTGVPVFAAVAQDRIQSDVSRVTLASSLGVVAVLWGLFRTWRSLPAISLVLAFAFGSGALATQWLFGYVHGLTLALGATLIGVCVDYPIHLLAHCREEGGTDRVARRLWPALGMGALTTLIGYLALAATGYPGFQQTAAFAGMGILAAVLVTRYLLPVWVSGGMAGPPRLLGLEAWLGLCRKYPRRVLAGVALLLAPVLWFLPRLQWLDDLERLAEIDSRLRRVDRELRSRLGDIEPGRAVLVEASDLETGLQRAEAATRILRRLKTEGKLADFQGIYPWLVSEALQQANWQHYRDRITPQFASAWGEALRAQGLAAGPLALAIPGKTSSAWLESEKILDSGIEEILVGQIDRAPDGVHLALWLGPHEPAALAAALDDLAGVRYFSQRDQINALAERYRRRAVKALGVGVGVIFLLLTVRYRSLGQAARILMPGLVGMAFIFACFAALAQPVSFFHLIATLLAVAICVDYGIFYTERRAGDALATYRAMGASMLTTVTAFAALGLAENPVLQMLSIAVTGGVGIGFLLCPALISAHSVTPFPKEC